MDKEILPSQDVITKTAEHLRDHGFEVTIAQTKAEALELIKTIIPKGAEVMNGSSTTLNEIGFTDYLKSGTHGWNNLHAAILAEKDPAKQKALRKQAILAEYFLGSVHAVTEEGELVTASASGSQIPSYAYSSDNVVWVVSTQKIVPTLDDALRRIREYVLPLEDKRMKDAGMGGSMLAKILINAREPAFMQRKVRVILVNELLGF